MSRYFPTERALLCSALSLLILPSLSTYALQSHDRVLATKRPVVMARPPSARQMPASNTVTTIRPVTIYYPSSPTKPPPDILNIERKVTGINESVIIYYRSRIPTPKKVAAVAKPAPPPTSPPAAETTAKRIETNEARDQQEPTPAPPPVPEAASEKTPSEEKPSSGEIDLPASSASPENKGELETVEPAPLKASAPDTSEHLDTASTDNPTVVEETSVSSGSTDLEALGDDPVALNNAAVRLTQEARYAEASELLQLAVQGSPNVYKLHRNLSIIYESLHKSEEALASARTAVKLAPNEPTALVQLCGIELQKHLDNEALVSCRQFYTLAPHDTLAQTFYGIALVRHQKSKEAIPLLEKVVLLKPPSVAALNALGMAYYNEKRYPDAIAAFKSGIETDPGGREIRFNLAVTHMVNGNKEGALSQYRILKGEDTKLAGQLYRIIFSDKVVYVDQLKRR